MKVMKLSFLGVLLAVTLTGCIVKEPERESDRYSFWRGDVENFYYIVDINGQPLHKIVGKPFMIMEYNPLNNYPIRVEIGLYQARNEYLPGAQNPIPQPFITADQLNYANRLGISGSVDLLCNWCAVSSESKLPSGDFEFWVDKGVDYFGNHEILYFTRTTDLMVGEIQNTNAEWGGRFSDKKAFSLVRRFNDNTPY